MLIRFSEQDLDDLHKHAAERYYGNRAKGTYEINKFHNQGTKADVEGLFGEWGLCDALGEPRTDSLEPDPGWDVVYRGRKIDVKATSYTTGRLLVPINRPIECDFLVLAIVNVGAGSSFLAGGISTYEYMTQCKVMNFGRGDTYAMEQRDLYQWDEFKEILDAVRYDADSNV